MIDPIEPKTEDNPTSPPELIPKKRNPLTRKRQAWVEEYLKCWNATEAARRVGYSEKTARQIGSRLLTIVDIQDEIKRRVDELAMGANEILVGLTTQARGDLGVFFKIVEEWTFHPLPTYDIIDAREVEDATDPKNPVKRVSYWVRHVALDTDKLVDPRYSHLLHKFSDSPKEGLGIEIYNKQTALQTLAKIRNLLVNKVALTDPSGEKPYNPSVITVIKHGD